MRSLNFTRFPELDYACTEAINTLSTNLTFMGSQYRRIMVTSTNASEGKSFLAINMMRTLASLGKYVALVDADLRRSMVDARFGVQYDEGGKLGITHFLAGKCELNDVLYATNFKRAYFVPVGFEVSNSLALLSTPRFSYLIDQLAEQVDYVLVDAPPVGLIIDAAEIAKSCDGTLLAVSYNKVRRRELLETKLQIERTGCPVLGAVLNNVSFSTYSSKKYYNRSYYTHYTSGYYGKASDTSDAKPSRKLKKGNPQPTDGEKHS